jgi:hypothetical protein
MMKCLNCSTELNGTDRKFYVSVQEVKLSAGQPVITIKDFVFCPSCYTQMVGLDLK